jgi:hypothetical protein
VSRRKVVAEKGEEKSEQQFSTNFFPLPSEKSSLFLWLSFRGNPIEIILSLKE